MNLKLVRKLRWCAVLLPGLLAGVGLAQTPVMDAGDSTSFIATGATGFTLAWPADSLFALYAATNLAQPVVWTRATDDPVLTNGFWTLPLHVASNGQRFFRLLTP